MRRVFECCSVELSREYQEAAVPAAQILGLRVAGVDMLEGANGPQIMEVNSSPGLEGIEKCTKLDVAGLVIEYIAARVDFSEIDIRQRLTVNKGRGVSEIYIRKGSIFEGKIIASTNPRDNDINVLTLYRGTKIIPNSKNERELLADDRLLCFGKLDSMRGLLPPKAQRRRRRKVRALDTSVLD
jgi:ribosomal protein S6--L-glutamate ligase